MSEIAISIAVIYLLFVVILATRKPSYIQGRTIYLFRSLFPSWRFFEDICEIPTLYYRLETDSGEFGPWHECLEKLERSWNNLLLNPKGNLQLAYGSLLHQLENDIEEIDEEKINQFVDSTSYKLTEDLVRDQLRARDIAPGTNFQFKVASVQQGSSESTQDNLISITHRTKIDV